MLGCNNSQLTSPIKQVDSQQIEASKRASEVLKLHGISFEDLKNKDAKEADNFLKKNGFSMLDLYKESNSMKGFNTKFIFPWKNQFCDGKWYSWFCISDWWMFSRMGCNGPCS
ncbi:MAG: hypothetical protein AABZ74_14220 [Cyanobacteriota bacterium]